MADNVSLTSQSLAGSGASVGSIHRLLLPRKTKLVGEKKFLPVGEHLPDWDNVSFDQKFPFFPAPPGMLDVCLTKMSVPVRFW